MKRLYHIIAINDKTNKKVYITGYPMTHEKCMVMMSKQSKPAKDVRFMLEELTNA